MDSIDSTDATSALLDDSTFLDDPQPVYRRLRDECPVAWNQQVGFWALSHHRDVAAASADPGTFCSSRGIILSEIGVEYPAPPTIMHTDPPEHTRYRKLVQPAFSPRRIKAMEPMVFSRAGTLVARIPVGQPVDIVEALTAPLPLQVIADLLGVDDADNDRFLLWSDAAIPGAGDFTDDERMALIGEMVGYLLGAAAARREAPTGDLISSLATVELDGDHLSDNEIAMFLVQLLVAGNETTRHALSGGLLALADHPEQWEALRQDPALMTGAIEEILRWTTPVIAFMRTATHDTEVRGVTIRKDDPVLLLYAAANRDPDEFGPDAHRFDITRTPNHHLAFGFGAHFCVGSALARLEVRATLTSLLERFSTIRRGGDVVRSGSNVIAGLRSAELTFA